MKSLSSSQINQVMAILTERGISNNVLRDELTDHLCCAIEYHMSQDNSFEEAITLASQEFKLHEMNHIQSEVKNIQFSPYFLFQVRKGFSEKFNCIFVMHL